MGSLDLSEMTGLERAHYDSTETEFSGVTRLYEFYD
jgi:hypothetical protein